MSEVGPASESSTQIAGVLTPGAMPGLLREIYVGRRSGMLHFTREEERGKVCFIKGSIVFGGANMKECLMGETFVRHGLLEREQLEQGLEASRDSGKRLGEAILELGFMDRGSLDQALALHVREILMCVFSWTEGTYAFEEQKPEALHGFDRALPLSTADVILDAVWSVPDSDIINHALGDLDRILVPASDPLLKFQRVNLTPDDGFLLSRVDGTLPAREIFEIISASQGEVERRLFGLLCIGMVEFGSDAPKEEPAPPAGKSARASGKTAPPTREPASTAGEDDRSPQDLRRSILEAYSGLPDRDHFAILGLSRGATAAEVTAAYFRLVKAFHPDVQHDPALADLRTEVEAIFGRVAEAYEALADPERRAAYEASLRARSDSAREKPPPAEPEDRPAPEPNPELDSGRIAGVLDQASETFSAGDYWEALQLAQSIIPDAKGVLKGRARLLAARAYLNYPDHLKEAEDELRAAIQEDRHNAEALYLLGTIYEAAGAKDRAAMMFRKALGVEPRHSAALAKVADAAPPEPPRHGILNRLFGR